MQTIGADVTSSCYRISCCLFTTLSSLRMTRTFFLGAQENLGSLVEDRVQGWRRRWQQQEDEKQENP